MKFIPLCDGGQVLKFSVLRGDIKTVSAERLFENAVSGVTRSDIPIYGKAELREGARFTSERKPLSGLDRSSAYRLVLICPAPETISSDSQSDGFADSRRRTSCQVR